MLFRSDHVCPPVGGTAARIPLCNNTWSVVAFGLLVLAVVGGATHLWAERPRPVATFLLGIVASFFWLLILETAVWLRS